MQDNPQAKGNLKEQLSSCREINLSVIGRKSGRTITMPVWFVFEGETLYLLPAQGSDTQWYKNVLKHPLVSIDARGSESELKTTPITDPKQVAAIVQKFRDKHGSDVKTYYSKFDVAVTAHIS